MVCCMIGGAGTLRNKLKEDGDSTIGFLIKKHYMYTLYSDQVSTDTLLTLKHAAALKALFRCCFLCMHTYNMELSIAVVCTISTVAQQFWRYYTAAGPYTV